MTIEVAASAPEPRLGRRPAHGKAAGGLARRAKGPRNPRKQLSSSPNGVRDMRTTRRRQIAPDRRPLGVAPAGRVPQSVWPAPAGRDRELIERGRPTAAELCAPNVCQGSRSSGGCSTHERRAMAPASSTGDFRLRFAACSRREPDHFTVDTFQFRRVTPFADVRLTLAERAASVLVFLRLRPAFAQTKSTRRTILPATRKGARASSKRYQTIIGPS